MSQWEQDPAGVWAPPSYPELSLHEIEVRIGLHDLTHKAEAKWGGRKHKEEGGKTVSCAPAIC